MLGRNSALHFASADGHNPVLRALTNAGADVNLRNKLGGQPIHLASEPAVALPLLAFDSLPVDVSTDGETHS